MAKVAAFEVCSERRAEWRSANPFGLEGQWEFPDSTAVCSDGGAKRRGCLLTKCSHWCAAVQNTRGGV
ncbi:hypothetical protein TWF730_003521 [Orbilia blumenaviensis]|uniref:Uncharacterized protein n=1 Tax=Orbilia blumenaviensis TaxID=1796055 RepID=A0AAV9U541_9PEZI